jgi:hypothetical protein
MLESGHVLDNPESTPVQHFTHMLHCAKISSATHTDIASPAPPPHRKLIGLPRDDLYLVPISFLNLIYDSALAFSKM